MMKRFWILLGFVALSAGFLSWWFSPSQVIKRRTAGLMRMLSFEDGQGRAARQTGGYALHSLLAPEIELSSSDHEAINGLFPREQVESGFNWLAGQVVESSFRVERYESLVIGEKFAEMSLVADALMELPASKPVNGRYRVFLVWENSGSGWQLAHARWSRQAGG